MAVQDNVAMETEHSFARANPGLQDEAGEDYRQLTELLAADGYRLARRYFTWRRVEAGRELLRSDETRDLVVMIVRGKVETLRETEFSGRFFLTGRFGPGSLLGPADFEPGASGRMLVRTLAPTDCLVLTRDDFVRMSREHPELAVRVLARINSQLSERLRNALDRLVKVAF